ncbi:MAG: metallophosphoesterase [Nevskia sp.]|jgi:3',5'-cyclic AMP phosphodiesterase CpdA|nr:metallophosphoesterase [Nevskia sp.]MCK9385144.1 metallophosphoesterase [Nevskia sp.]
MTTLRLAHLSDPHLHFRALTQESPSGLSKRSLSRWSWSRGRGELQRPEVLAAAVDDIRSHNADHIAISGDITNFSFPGEFSAAAAWFATLGEAENVSVIPGNHDALVAVPWREGLGHWQPWMTADAPGAEPFPYLRVRGPMALIGLSSALPTPPAFASGRLGIPQLLRLEALLEETKARGLCRVVMLHHPPTDGVVTVRKALRDRTAFRAVLARAGAEMVLHGHSRDARFDPLPGPNGLIAGLGLPSISAIPNRHDEGARWHLLEIIGDARTWTIAVTARVYNPNRSRFETAGRYRLLVAPASGSVTNV